MENDYLTGMPRDIERYGLAKVLVVRKEVIHLKHVMTEVFVRKTVDIRVFLNLAAMDIMKYMEYMTNRMRKVHHFSRNYRHDVNKVVKEDRDRFALGNGLDVVLDATHLKYSYVQKWDKFSESFNISIKYFDISLEEALRRNSKRERKVLENVVRNQYERYQKLRNDI